LGKGVKIEAGYRHYQFRKDRQSWDFLGIFFCQSQFPTTYITPLNYSLYLRQLENQNEPLQVASGKGGKTEGKLGKPKGWRTGGLGEGDDRVGPGKSSKILQRSRDFRQHNIAGVSLRRT